MNTGGRLRKEPITNSLRIVCDSSQILTESPITAPSRRATSLRPRQFKHLIRVASVTGRMPERDVMLLWITHTTGVRVTELALLEVADVLFPSGAIKPEVYLRGGITKGCRPRNVYLTHARCLAALEDWIKVRLQRRWGLSGAGEYRGLRPGSKLVTTHKGQAFELAFKHRELDSGPRRFIGRVIRSSRPSADSTGRPVSSRDRRTVADAHWRPKCWRQLAMLRRCRPSLAMPALTTASLI